MSIGIGPGLGVGIGGSDGGSAVASPATFTMTQLSDTNRIYQRSATTGGAANKGQGSIDVTISSATAGVVMARRRAPDGVTIVQAEWTAATIANGATSVTVTGVDASNDWFYLDLKDASGWKNGTVLVGMGVLLAMSGQSRVQLMFNDSGAAPRLSDLGMTPNTKVAIFYTNSAGAAVSWRLVNNNTSSGAAELLDELYTMTGVVCGMVGHAIGASAISTWLPGQTNHTELTRVLGLVGNKFEMFWWYQGRADYQAALNYQTYFDRLTTLMTSVLGMSTITPAVYVSGITNWESITAGATWGAYYQIHRAQKDWCALNGATCTEWQDLKMSADGVHPINEGHRQTAYHMARTIRPAYVGGAQDDIGPRVTSITKSGANLILDLALRPGTSLVMRNNAAGRFRVMKAGDAAGTALTISSVTATGASQITVALAADPGDVSLEVHAWGTTVQLDGSLDGVFDDYTADGIPDGRHLKFETGGVFRKVDASDMSTAGVTFGAGGPFGQGRTNGKMSTTTIPVEGRFIHMGLTFECRVNFTSIPATRKAFFGAASGYSLCTSLTNNGFDVVINGTATNIPYTLATGVDYHLRLVFDNMNRDWRLYVNGSLVHQVADLASALSPGASVWSIGGVGGSATLDFGTGAIISDMAVFRKVLTRKGVSSFTVPTAAYSGTEDSLIHYWKCDGNGTDTAG